MTELDLQKQNLSAWLADWAATMQRRIMAAGSDAELQKLGERLSVLPQLLAPEQK